MYFKANCIWDHIWFPCYLDSHTPASNVDLACAQLSCIQKMLWLPMLGIVSVHKDVHPSLYIANTFSLHIVGVNSPIFLKRNFYTMHTLTQWVKIHPQLLHSKTLWCTPWVKFTHGFNTVKLLQCWLCDKFSKLLFDQHNCISCCHVGKKILIKSGNFLSVAQKLKELWIFRSICG